MQQRADARAGIFGDDMYQFGVRRGSLFPEPVGKSWSLFDEHPLQRAAGHDRFAETDSFASAGAEFGSEFIARLLECSRAGTAQQQQRRCPTAAELADAAELRELLQQADRARALGALAGPDCAPRAASSGAELGAFPDLKFESVFKPPATAAPASFDPPAGGWGEGQLWADGAAGQRSLGRPCIAVCRLRDGSLCEYWSPGELCSGDLVFVPDDRGKELVDVVQTKPVPYPYHVFESHTVLGKGTAADAAYRATWLPLEETQAAVDCQELCNFFGLQLTVTRSVIRFDQQKITFFYKSPGMREVRIHSVLAACKKRWNRRIWFALDFQDSVRNPHHPRGGARGGQPGGAPPPGHQMGMMR